MMIVLCLMMIKLQLQKIINQKYQKKERKKIVVVSVITFISLLL
jgi:hypothetical protein